MAGRQRQYGGVIIQSPETMKTELKHMERAMGLGYLDGPDNTLSPFVFGEMKDANGPYEILFKAWQTEEQLLELVTMLASWATRLTVSRCRNPVIYSLRICSGNYFGTGALLKPPNTLTTVKPWPCGSCKYWISAPALKSSGARPAVASISS